MRKIRCALALLVVTATASAAGPDVVQISNGAEYTGGTGPQTRKYATTAWDQDVTPNAPGNADKSVETFLIDFKTNALTQVTSLATGGHATPIAWLPDGRLLLRADGDVTTAGSTPGGGSRLFLHKPARGGRAGTTTLVSPTLNFGAGPFTVRVAPNGKTWFFDSIADLVPGGNTDQTSEVFAFDAAKKTVRQLTNGPAGTESVFLGLVDKARRALIWSTADLTGQGTNGTGTSAAFLVDLKTSAIEQLTPSGVGNGIGSAVKIDRTGRWFAFHFIVNEGQTTHYDWNVYDLKTRTYRPVMSDQLDGAIAFVPASSLVLLNTKQDLVPSATLGQGNADGSFELFTMDLKTGAVVQRTASDKDTFFEQAGANRNAPVVVTSQGDLAPNAPGNAGGVKQIFLVSVAPRPKPTAQLTAGAQPSTPDFVVGAFVVFSNYGDLVPGGNADESREIFAVNLKGAPKVRQVSNGVGKPTYTWGNPPPDGKSVFLASEADLTPGAPGNADGSEELFRAKIK